MTSPRTSTATVNGSGAQPSDRAIENLIARYAELTDAGDFAGLGQLLDRASFVLNQMETVRGQAAVEQLAHETLVTYADGTPKTRHVTTNILVEVDEEAGHAAARSYFTVFQALPDFPLQPVASGRYRDQFTRTDGQWHFAERHVLLDFQGDVSHHVLTGPERSGP
jgi:3-phenylpropionate/cinnamic acid dioxygenase small subunit